MMGRLILVSNRLPVTVRRSGGKEVLARATGGLVAGLGPVHDRGDSLWIGIAEGTPPSGAALEKARLVAVPLPAEIAKRHYEGYSNQVLWPLFHYLTDLSFEGADFDAYR